MLNILFNTTLFFLISIFFYLSISGYGKILIKRTNNFFELTFFGLLIKTIIGYIIYVTIGTNELINILLIIIGLVLYFFYKKKIIKINLIYLILLFLLSFSVLLISKTHEDFNYYHYFSIHEIFNNNLRIGISNLNERFFHSSLLAYEQSLLVMPYFNLKLVHLSPYFIFISSVGYFLNTSLSKKTKSDELFFSIICLIILLIKFNRLSEFGYDYISQFLLLIVFHKSFFLTNKKEEQSKSILIYMLSILIKPITLLFLPIIAFLIIKKDIISFIRLIVSKKILYFVILFIILSSSFYRTGCIFYPVNFTCFSKDKIFWSEKERLKNYSEYVTLWAKGYYIKEDSKYDKISDKAIYKKNFNWVKFWIEKHFFYKVFEFLIIVIFSIIVVFLYFKRKKNDNASFKIDKYAIIILTFFSIFLWFLLVPQFRFGFASIIIFIYLILSFFFNLNILKDKNKLISLIFFCLLVLNTKNFIRINSEIKRDDFYKFQNFPYFNEIKIKDDFSNVQKSKFLHIEILK